ncbi:ArsR/SmtB family transcription factor [Haloarchaeobius sp. HRN-SO-5]|uniref:ArsR/SmtB family transcription factor n=1 Tax=Haloarchaeobius sp. HRN-SO-5 TaxID=3446118 RepID=UPI003EB8E4A8
MTADPDSPADAFAAVGNEWRVAILRTLADAADQDRPVRSFSEIYDRLDIESTSQLSYHLEYLDGVFVRKSGDGYSLTQAGDRVVRAIRAGTYTDRPSFERTELDGQCPVCPATTLVAAFRDGFLTVECDACGTRVVTYDLPPAEARRETPLAVLRSCDQRVHQEYATAVRGTCPTCGGATDVEPKRHDGPEPLDYYGVATCEQCGHQVFAPLGVRLLYHPAVVSFFWDHGVDATAVPFWQVHAVLDDWEVDRVQSDPPRFAVTVACDGETMRVELDEALRVSLPDGPPSSSVA